MLCLLRSAANKDLDKRIVSVRQRILKHLGASSPALAESAWRQLEALCCSQWGVLEKQLRQLLPDMRLELSPQALQRMFKTAVGTSS